MSTPRSQTRGPERRTGDIDLLTDRADSVDRPHARIDEGVHSACALGLVVSRPDTREPPSKSGTSQSVRQRHVIEAVKGSPTRTTCGAGRFSEFGGAVHGSTQIA